MWSGAASTASCLVALILYALLRLRSDPRSTLRPFARWLLLWGPEGSSTRAFAARCRQRYCDIRNGPGRPESPKVVVPRGVFPPPPETRSAALSALLART